MTSHERPIPGPAGPNLGGPVDRDDAFTTLGLARLVSYIAPGNAPSIRVARRMGAACEGKVSGSQVWVHCPDSASAKQKADAMKTSEQGD